MDTDTTHNITEVNIIEAEKALSEIIDDQLLAILNERTIFNSPTAETGTVNSSAPDHITITIR